ncbi:MAG: glycosyltransferase [Rhodanobacteraceae bacterium]
MGQRRLTVVQLIPALESGGAERSALEVAQALCAAHHRSIVVSAGGRMLPRLLEQGSEHVTLPIGHKSPGSLRHVAALRRLMVESGADIVHARSRLPAWLGRMAMTGLASPPHFLTTMHGLNAPGWYSAVMVRGERVICVSNTVRDHILHYYPRTDPNRLVLIPRGIDPTAFPFGYRPDDEWRQRFFDEFPQLGDAPLLTLPGRGTRLKGHAHAIKLLAALKARGIETRLLLLGAREVGREAYVGELERQARTLGVADDVMISPPRDDVRDVYAVSDLVLQLSDKPESFGRTVIEALALCRPVLGFAHGGVGELLAELYPAGRVPAGDDARLVERAAELLRLAPPIAPLKRYQLVDMQQATLNLYSQITDV